MTPILWNSFLIFLGLLPRHSIQLHVHVIIASTLSLSVFVNFYFDLPKYFPALQFSLHKLRGIKLPRVTVEALFANLGLSLDDVHTVPFTLERVCSIWTAREINPFIEDLVQALVVTKTTGRYASLVCSTKGEATCTFTCAKYVYTHINPTTTLTWWTECLHIHVTCVCIVVHYTQLQQDSCLHENPFQLGL